VSGAAASPVEPGAVRPPGLAPGEAIRPPAVEPDREGPTQTIRLPRQAPASAQCGVVGGRLAKGPKLKNIRKTFGLATIAGALVVAPMAALTLGAGTAHSTGQTTALEIIANHPSMSGHLAKPLARAVIPSILIPFCTIRTSTSVPCSAKASAHSDADPFSKRLRPQMTVLRFDFFPSALLNLADASKALAMT